ncbi:hypothetical protein AV530_018243 [Patagioenas fasciata monilis]|uniref:Uncharacterized protein n=1 Tax=Patagioenas fasciata monilis TaxID=372326 RepID=A0A1V4JR98_PATFA|nr:hypothetical protein AV530_018243 [Patagioenas fasciata monilis]
MDKKGFSGGGSWHPKVLHAAENSQRVGKKMPHTGWRRQPDYHDALRKPVCTVFFVRSDLQLLLKRKGGLLVESLPSAGSADAAEMIPGTAIP